MKKVIILTAEEGKQFLASFYADWFADDKKYAKEMILAGVIKNVPNLGKIDGRWLAQNLHDTVMAHDDWCRQRNLVADEIYMENSVIIPSHPCEVAYRLYKLYPVEHGKNVQVFARDK